MSVASNVDCKSKPQGIRKSARRGGATIAKWRPDPKRGKPRGIKSAVAIARSEIANADYVSAVAKLMATHRKAVEEHKALLAMPAAKAAWFAGSDEKGKAPPEPDFREFKAQAAMLRSTLKTLGLRSVQMVMPITVTFSGNASGIVAAPTVVNVSSCPEWAAITELWDEYKFVKGRYEFIPVQPSRVGANLGIDDMFVIGYDPVESLALTGVQQGCQLAQHEFLAPRVYFYNGTPTSSAYLSRFDGKPFVFNWNTHGVAATIGAASTTPNLAFPGQWKTTVPLSGGLNDGWLKVYTTINNTTSPTAVTGVAWYTIDVRSRT